MTDALAVLSGLLIGVLSGLIGIGGGVLLVPLLVIGFGFSQQVAQGTSLAALIPTSIVGAVTHQRQGSLDVRFAAVMGVAGIVGAGAAAVVAQHVHGKVLERLFGLLLIFAAYRLWRRS